MATTTAPGMCTGFSLPVSDGGGGGGGGGGSVTPAEEVDLDLTSAPNEGPYTTDSGTIDIDDAVSGAPVTVNYKGFRSTSLGTFEFINGQGMEVVGVGAGANNGCLRLDNLISGWGYAYLQRRLLIVELFVSTYSGAVDGDGYLCGVSSQARHNGSLSRGIQLVRDDGNTVEDLFLRYATSTVPVTGQQARPITTNLVHRYIITAGDKTQHQQLTSTDDDIDPGDTTDVITIRSNADNPQAVTCAYSGQFWVWLGAKANGVANYTRVRVRSIQYADLPP